MRKELTLLVITCFTVSSCNSSKLILPIEKNDWYKVTNIERIKNVFVIDVTRKDAVYRICSRTVSIGVKECNELKEGTYYPLRLKSIVPKEFGGMSMFMANRFISGISFYDTIINFRKDGEHDLFVAENLTGLCISKK
jgi:hypothetical protein